MAYVLLLFFVLAICFVAANLIVNRVYQSGHKIYGLLVGFLSFLVLILAQVLTRNQIVLYIAQLIFMFGCVVFFMASSRNYLQFQAGKGTGWFSKRLRKVQALNKQHNQS